MQISLVQQPKSILMSQHNHNVVSITSAVCLLKKNLSAVKFYFSYCFHSIPSGGLRSTLPFPMSPQLVLSTVPPDSIYSGGTSDKGPSKGDIIPTLQKDTIRGPEYSIPPKRSRGQTRPPNVQFIQKLYCTHA